MKKGLRLLFIFALLITLVACGDREIPTFDDILNQTVNVGSDARNWEEELKNLSDNETSEDALVIEVEDNVNYDVPGTYNVTITVTDESDNVTSATFTVTVVDNVKPVISLVGNAQVSIIAGESFTDPGATFTDNIDGTGAATVSGSVNAAVAGTYTLTYSYTDAAGNAADTVTRTVTVIPVDTQAPVVTLNGDATLTVEAGSTFTDPGATFSDNLDGTGNAVASGTVDTSALGSYTVTYSYTDAQGNAATSVTRTINVVDTTAPVITVANATVTIEVGSTFTNPTANASDNLDADATVTATGTVDASVVGSYTLTYNHTDAQGNVATAVTVTVVVEDTTAPVVTLTGNAALTVEAGSTFTDAGATAVDNYDTSASVVVTGTVDTSSLGIYTLTYTSTDAAGNSSNVTRTVTVVDNTAPVITLNGNASVTVQINEAYTELNATATDNLDANVSVSVTGTVDTTTVGAYTITYTATDAAGNTSTLTRTVNVSDTPPRLAQYAPAEGDTLSIGRYYKFGTIELFLLNYSDKALVVIFEDQTVIDEFEFELEPNGPSQQMPTNIFNNVFSLSSKAILISSYNIQDNSYSSFLFNLETKTVDNSIPSGFVRWYATGPNQGPTGSLIDFDRYYYVVSKGDDRGIYKFNEDLTLTKYVTLQQDYDSVYFRFYNDEYSVFELSSNGMNYSTFSLVLSNSTGDILQTFDNTINRIFMMGNKLFIENSDYNRQDNRVGIFAFSDNQVEITYVATLFVFSDENMEMGPQTTANSLGVTFYDDVNNETQLRFYDDSYTQISIRTFTNTWSFDQDGDYIIVVERGENYNNYSLNAYKNDGSDPIVADFGFTREFITINTSYMFQTNYNVERPFNYLYFVQGTDTNNENTITKVYYFEDEEFVGYDLDDNFNLYGNSSYFYKDNSKVLVMSVEQVYGENDSYTSSGQVLVLDLVSQTATTSETFNFDTSITRGSSNYVFSGDYAVFSYSEETNYSSMKHLIFVDTTDMTVKTVTLEEAITQSYFIGLIVSEDKVTLQFNQFNLETTISNFGETFTQVDSTPGGGGGGGKFVVDDIVNEDDFILQFVFGEMGPSIQLTWNGTVTGTISVANTGYSVYVYDGEGTENDTVYIVFEQDGYAIDVQNPTVTFQGVMTSTGFLTLDDNYNETFGAIPITSDMYLEIFIYYQN